MAEDMARLLDNVRHWRIEQTVKTVKALEEQQQAGDRTVTVDIDYLKELHMRALSLECQLERAMIHLGKTAEWDSMQSLFAGMKVQKQDTTGGTNGNRNSELADGR